MKKITRLVGIEAFRAQKEELGVVDALRRAASGRRQRHDPGWGGGRSRRRPAPLPAAPATGNWVQQGTPGVTDAYAPPSAVQSRPGDVPKAAPPPPPK